MKLKLLALTLGALTLSACATTSSYKLPTARTMSPEAEGEKHLGFLVGRHEGREVTVTSNIGVVPVASSRHDSQTNVQSGGLFTYGVLEKLDLGATLELFMPSIYFAKYQLIGDPKITADAHNFSFSVLAGLGMESTDTTDSADVFNNSPGSIHRESSTIYQFGGIAGYRPLKELLILFGGTYTTHSYTGTQTFTNGSTENFAFDSRYSEFHTGAQYSIGSAPDAFVIQMIFYRGFLNSFGIVAPSSTFSIDIGCGF